MARWTPKDNEAIAPSEQLGRRLFDEPKLSGAPDQKPFAGLRIDHFIEKRGREFSIDRLGRTSIDHKVVAYLKPRCNHVLKERQAKRFDGWAIASAKKLPKDSSWTLHPSGIREKDAGGVVEAWSETDLKQNMYHGHVLMPATVDNRLFAFDIREQFVNVGGVYPIVRPPICERIYKLVVRLLKKARRLSGLTRRN